MRLPGRIGHSIDDLQDALGPTVDRMPSGHSLTELMPDESTVE